MEDAIQKYEILNHLNILLAFNVLGDIQYKNRYNGFIGELNFQEWFKLNKPEIDTFSGGFFLSNVRGVPALESSIYFTVSKDNVEKYVELYHIISKLGCSDMYFIKWTAEIPFGKWRKEDVLQVGRSIAVPEVTVYRFDIEGGKFTESSLDAFLSFYSGEKASAEDKTNDQLKQIFTEKLGRFDEALLLDLYVQRLFFDGFIGLRKERGIPADIDMIIRSPKNGKIVFFEIKEKDLSKREPKGFGMDTARIEALEHLMNVTGVEVFYIVKQIDNQDVRRFLKWRIISMHKFIENLPDWSVEGGTGMRAETTSNPTKICSEEHFLEF